MGKEVGMYSRVPQAGRSASMRRFTLKEAL